MSDFGVLLSTSSGQPFVTPVSTPMSMYGKYIVNSSGGSAASSIDWPASWPAMVFVKSNLPGVIVGASKGGGKIYFSGSDVLNRNFTITAYIFGIFPQTAPAWGLVVWDAAGQVVLTNETRVLSDLVTVGTPGVGNGRCGLTMDITLSGSYAVCGVIHGMTLFQTSAPGGQIVIIPVTAYTSCAYNGVSTRFTAATSQQPGGSPVGSSDSGCILTAINTAAYD